MSRKILLKVCIDGPQEADYEVLGFKTLDTQGEIFAEFSPEAALQLAEEVLGIQVHSVNKFGYLINFHYTPGRLYT